MRLNSSLKTSQQLFGVNSTYYKGSVDSLRPLPNSELTQQVSRKPSTSSMEIYDQFLLLPHCKMIT